MDNKDTKENKQEGLIPAYRQEKIVELVNTNGVVKVTELSEFFDVSTLTIRRDLALLEEKGVLERSHGGAIPVTRVSIESHFTQKEKMFTVEKQEIADLAEPLIEDGETIFVNSGSTTLQVLERLKNRKIRIITNNGAAANVLDGGVAELILLGGQYRSKSKALIGSFTNHNIEQIYVDKSIIGVDGFSVKSGLTSPIEQEAEATKLMIKHTIGQVIVVADHKKIGAISNFVTSDISGIDVLVTDSKGVSLLDTEKLKELGVKLVFNQD
ncbi:MAG: DeoR/GlpR transcriptional regulator [Spirochaetales bacterium]|nr:DeoR/GlpR transcriptional regulator [Spirochaetales bacterium]